MEVFVYFHMGGSIGRITLLPLVEDGVESAEGKAAELSRLEALDASKAQCFKAEDREQLLAVIEVSYGTTSAFNRVVRSLLLERQESNKLVSRGGRTILRDEPPREVAIELEDARIRRGSGVPRDSLGL